MATERTIRPRSLIRLLEQDRTLVMGVLNVTPDSFSDGGQFHGNADAAVKAAAALLEAGADVLDIGGESTRPGAQEVPADEECRRVVEVIARIHRQFPDALISIDTRKSLVAHEALSAGASIVNDVSGLRFDPALADVVAGFDATYILMHSLGTPETMQDDPTYIDVVTEIRGFLLRQTQYAMDHGIAKPNIWIDPGFGFGKTLEHNLALMNRLEELTALGFPMLVGTSRKSFMTLGDSTIAPGEREALTAATLALAVRAGARMVRIHDVQRHRPVVRLADRIVRQ